MKLFPTLLLLCFSLFVNAQMKVMDQSVYSEWKTIRSEAISNDGQWVQYQLTPGFGDKTLVLYNTLTNVKMEFPRVKRSMLSEDSKYAIFTVGAATDTITYKKRRRVDKKKMPKDSLIVLNLASQEKVVIPDVGSFKAPSKWSGILAYEATIKIPAKDSTGKDKAEQRFFIRYLSTGMTDTLENVDAYAIAEKAQKLVYHRGGTDTSIVAGVFLFDTAERTTIVVAEGSGEYKNVRINETGDKVAYVSDLDTTKRRVRPYELNLWADGSLSKIVSAKQKLMSEDFFISEYTRPSFSEDGTILYFGIGARPVIADSLALDEEQVQVEVWTTEDPMLYTMQEVRKNALVKETYQVRYDIQSGKMQALEGPRRKGLSKSLKGNGKYMLVEDSQPYMKSMTWSGRSTKDLYIIDGSDGDEKLVEGALTGFTNFSPTGKYVFWYDQENLDYFTYEVSSGKKVNITNTIPTSIVNELHDSPSKPRSYGSGGWTANDEYLLIYDRYDIWKVDPKGLHPPMKLTAGREDRMQRRIIDLDREKDEVETESMVYLFNEKTKESGYGKVNIDNGASETMVLEPYSYERRPMKARDVDHLIYTKESFTEFPDLRIAKLDMQFSTVISSANPQQDSYRWGNIELFEWIDDKGAKVQGLLVKPEGFDPNKKYPVIVNFYERSSDGLHRHRAPEPHRSTINYTYYANKGYIIFNPDVSYEIGEPGASAEKAVISGVEALSKNQFIDKSRIGVQGHSWGGYQIAHLLNKTNIFKCAESGAPVVNMVSAYGGIRWGSGMSRMFQYEKTQSRLGKTLWEDREVYLRNSPIFELNKTETPVLILHNDNDSAVPWYQGIEYFMALRRLGKPAWFLNYNGEPHWPLKWQNRLDFNKRMEQFFAHYLLDQPMPKWMKEGVSVVNKGVNQGFEIDE